MTAPITITIKYFAILREQRGLAEEQLTIDPMKAGDLYRVLAARHGFTLTDDRVRLALASDFALMSHMLADGDSITFIPPVAGG